MLESQGPYLSKQVLALLAASAAIENISLASACIRMNSLCFFSASISGRNFSPTGQVEKIDGCIDQISFKFPLKYRIQSEELTKNKSNGWPNIDRSWVLFYSKLQLIWRHRIHTTELQQWRYKPIKVNHTFQLDQKFSTFNIPEKLKNIFDVFRLRWIENNCHEDAHIIVVTANN